MILLDFSQTVIGSYMGVARGASEVDEDLLRHLVLSTIKTFRIKFHEEYGEMVICADSSRNWSCLLYTSPSPRDRTRSRMPSSA